MSLTHRHGGGVEIDVEGGLRKRDNSGREIVFIARAIRDFQNIVKKRKNQ